MTNITLLGLPELLQRQAAIGKSKAYADIAAGLMVPPVKLGGKNAWPSHEVDAILRARIAGKTDDQIRALVRELVAARGEEVNA